MVRKVPPLLLLLKETISVRDLLFNRFTALIVVVLIASTGTVAYVGANDGGDLTGRVVTEDGDAVSGATVRLEKIPLQGVVKRETTTTGPDGKFSFTDEHSLLEYRLVVLVDGKTVERVRGHLYFKGQNRHVTIVVEESELPA